MATFSAIYLTGNEHTQLIVALNKKTERNISLVKISMPMG